MTTIQKSNLNGYIFDPSIGLVDPASKSSPVSFSPSHTTTPLDTLTASLSPGTLDDYIQEYCQSLDGVKYSWRRTRLLPMDLWDAVTRLCAVYSKNAPGGPLKASETQSLILSKGVNIIRSWGVYNRLQGQYGDLMERDITETRVQRMRRLDYRLESDGLRTFRADHKIKCLVETGEIMDDMEVNLRADSGTILIMCLIASFSQCDNRRVSKQLVYTCQNELVNFHQQLDVLSSKAEMLM
jgi:hypothetical protein